MKALNTTPRIAQDPALVRELMEHAMLVNAVAASQIAGAVNARPSVPTTGKHMQGDFIRNSAPVEAGTSGSKYVVFGWLCVASGEPGTFVSARFLTGN